MIDLHGHFAYTSISAYITSERAPSGYERTAMHSFPKRTCHHHDLASQVGDIIRGPLRFRRPRLLEYQGPIAETHANKMSLVFGCEDETLSMISRC